MNMAQFVDSRIGSCFFYARHLQPALSWIYQCPIFLFSLLFILQKEKKYRTIEYVILHLTTFVLLFLNRESDKTEEDGSSSSSGKRQLKLSSFGVTTSKRKNEEQIESSGKSRCKFFQARKLEQLANF